MKKHKSLFHWLEPLGLALLLISFGWQCLEEHSYQMKIEGYVYELNEKMLAVLESVYDEAVHSDRYHGKAMVSVNYDALYTQMKDWQQMQEELKTIEKQADFSFWMRVVLYVIGSSLVIMAKYPKGEYYIFENGCPQKHQKLS